MAQKQPNLETPQKMQTLKDLAQKYHLKIRYTTEPEIQISSVLKKYQSLKIFHHILTLISQEINKLPSEETYYKVLKTKYPKIPPFELRKTAQRLHTGHLTWKEAIEELFGEYPYEIISGRE